MQVYPGISPCLPPLHSGNSFLGSGGGGAGFGPSQYAYQYGGPPGSVG